jgi:hypothetical protein
MIQIYNNLHQIHHPNHNPTNNSKTKILKQNNQSNSNSIYLEKPKKD